MTTLHERRPTDTAQSRSPILIVCGAGYVSGKEIMSLTLADLLINLGNDVTFVTSTWHDGRFQQRLLAKGIGFTPVPIGFISATLTRECVRMTLDQMRRWPELMRKFSAVLRELQPARVVHTNWHHLIVLWPLLSPKRDFFWCHEVVPQTGRYRVVFSRMSERLAGFVAVSEAVRCSLLSLGIPEAKVQVIYNGVTTTAPSSIERAERPAGRPLQVGICGQVAEFKGHTDIVEAFGRLAKSECGAVLHVFGTGSASFERELRARITRSGIHQAVRWHGFVDNIATMYRGLDLVVVPSRFPDPLPTTAIEAAMSGLPVVATSLGGLPEIVVDGETGFLVQPNNPEELANRIETLAQNHAMRLSMGGAASQRARELFSSERFARSFQTLLRAS